MSDDAETVREAVEYCRRDAVYHPAIAALSRLTARLDAERWQPIETAPRDGTELLGHADGELWIIQWCAANRRFESERMYFGRHLTHWRPLPTPPEADHG